MIVYSDYLSNLILTVLSEKISSGGYTGPLNGCSVMLFSNNFLLTPHTAFADLVESAYSGYARKTNVGWGTAVRQSNGTYTQLSDLLQFAGVGASGFVTGLVSGWALITAGASPILLMSELLAQPHPIVNPGDGFGLVIQNNYSPGNPASFGNVILP